MSARFALLALLLVLAARARAEEAIMQVFDNVVDADHGRFHGRYPNLNAHAANETPAPPVAPYDDDDDDHEYYVAPTELPSPTHTPAPAPYQPMHRLHHHLREMRKELALLRRMFNVDQPPKLHAKYDTVHSAN